MMEQTYGIIGQLENLFADKTFIYLISAKQKATSNNILVILCVHKKNLKRKEVEMNYRSMEIGKAPKKSMRIHFNALSACPSHFTWIPLTFLIFINLKKPTGTQFYERWVIRGYCYYSCIWSADKAVLQTSIFDLRTMMHCHLQIIEAIL